MSNESENTAKQSASTLRNAAVEQQRAMREANWKMWNEADNWMFLGGDGLVGCGDEGVELLRALLKDRNAHVRLAAARFLLWRDEKTARGVLRKLQKQRNITGLLAHEYLALWDDGKLQPPPSVVIVKRRS